MPTHDKQRTPIVLPAQTWVSQWHLRRAIAQAFFPDHRKSAGVDLLTSKTLRSGTGAGFPYKLSNDDRSLLACLAPQLPPLHLTGSASEWSIFLEAFVTATPEINWSPLRPSELNLAAEYDAGMAVADEHIQVLRKLLATAGKPRARNDSKAMVSQILGDTSLARDDLEAYFTDLEIPFIVERVPRKLNASHADAGLQLQPVEPSLKAADVQREEPQPAELELAPIEPSGKPPSSEPGLAHLDWVNRAGGPKKRFTPEELDLLIQRNVDGEIWPVIAGELGMALKTLESHLTAHRKWKRAQQSSESARDAFGRIAAAVSQPKPHP